MPIRQQLTAIHGWSGTLLGIFLYWVILTGALAVIADDINDWAEPLANSKEAQIGIGTDAHLRTLSQQVKPEYLDDVFVFATSDKRQKIFFHTHQKQPDGSHVDVGQLFVINPMTGHIIEQAEGTLEEASHQLNTGKLGRFIVEWHVQLHVPEPYGLILTGVLGLALLLACISGIVMHRHLIRDAFIRRRRNGDLLSKKDTHTVASTWNLPFAIILSFTGSFFSLAGAFAIPVIAIIAFGGDQELLIETVQGTPAVDERAAPLQNIDPMLTQSVQQSGAPVRFVEVTHWGRADSRVNVHNWVKDGDLLNQQFAFNGATGEFLGSQTAIGQQPSLGNDLISLMGPLHFGNFAGWSSKLLWLLMGFASAYATVTGMNLWTKRRQDNPVWRRFYRLNLASTWGLPLALTGVAILFLFSHVGYIDGAVEPMMFQLFTAIIVAALIISYLPLNVSTVRYSLILLNVVGLSCLPILRFILLDPDTSNGTINTTSIVIDSLCVITALLMTLSLYRSLTSLLLDKVANTADLSQNTQKHSI